MRWLWFVLSVLCFAVAFRTHSMGLAAVTLLAALGFLLMGTLALASSRIEARGRDVSELMGPDEIRRMAEIERRKKAAQGDGSVSPAAAGSSSRRDPDHDADGAADGGGGDGGGGD